MVTSFHELLYLALGFVLKMCRQGSPQKIAIDFFQQLFNIL